MQNLLSKGFVLPAIVFIVMLGSCRNGGFREPEKTEEEREAERYYQAKEAEMGALPLEEVTTPPRFEACPEQEPREQQAACFILELQGHVQEYLQNSPVSYESFRGPAEISFVMDTLGKAREIRVSREFMIPQAPSDSLLSAAAAVKASLLTAVQRLPPASPATKEGRPVPVKIRVSVPFPENS